MNRAEIREKVYDRLGVDSSDGLSTTAVVDRAVNSALHDIEVRFDWPWLQTSATFTTVGGTDTYAMPADWLRTSDVMVTRSDASHLILGTRGIMDLEDRYPDNYQGQPREFAVDADQLVLRPIPDGVYSVKHRYIKRESDLTDDGQSSLMPASFHDVIVERAAALVARRNGDSAREMSSIKAFEEALGQMADNRRRVSGTMKVRVRPGSML